MLATVALAVAIPVALGAAGSWTIRGQTLDVQNQTEPYLELLASVDLCIQDIRHERSAQSNPLDWRALVALRPPPLEQPAEESLPVPRESKGLSPLFNLYLDGIAYKERESMHYAYVSGQVLEEGDWLDGFQVVSIERSRVTFKSSDDQVYTIDIDEQLREEHPGYLIP